MSVKQQLYKTEQRIHENVIVPMLYDVRSKVGDGLHSESMRTLRFRLFISWRDVVRGL